VIAKPEVFVRQMNSVVDRMREPGLNGAMSNVNPVGAFTKTDFNKAQQ